MEIAPQELKERMDKGDRPFLLDVREKDEFAISNMGGVLIPLGDLPSRYRELDPEIEIIVHCHHGMRSRQAVGFLRQHGYAKARNLTGGIDCWSIQIDPSIPRY